MIEFEKLLDERLAGAETPKRGRPRKDQGPQELQPAELDVKIIAQALQVPFDLWSISQDIEQLKLSDQESRLVAKPVKELLDHYLPHIPVIAWAWISMSAVSYSIMKSRLVLLAEIRKSKVTSAPDAKAGEKYGSFVQPQGHGGPRPSGVWPTIEQITEPVV